MTWPELRAHSGGLADLARALAAVVLLAVIGVAAWRDGRES